MYYLQGVLELAVGLLMGYYARTINDKLDTIINQKPGEPSVVSGNPDFYNVNKLSNSSAIVDSKTPQQVQWEEDQIMEKQGKFGGRSKGEMK